MAVPTKLPPQSMAAELPDRLPEPQLPQSVRVPPSGDGWIHEVKFDGYRMLARIDGHDVRLQSRHGVDWTEKFGPVVKALQSLDRRLILDGEMTVLGPDGRPEFSRLRKRRTAGDLLVYYVFDILHLDGHDLRRVVIEERKAILADVVAGFSHPDPVQVVEHFRIDGKVFYDHVVEHELEGVVSKRLGSRYHSGSSSAWLKAKNKQQLPFVICGYERAQDSGYELLVGYYERGTLVYAGRVGLGFTARHRNELRDALEETKTCPFPAWRGRDKAIRWVQPTQVALVEQGAWKGAGFLREAVFLGLLTEISATDVSVA